jgi:Tfp pilus assembly protein PilV
MRHKMSTRKRSKRGFALPMALLVMVVLTAGIAAGFSATSAEVVTNQAHRGDTRAYNLAQAGLEQFLARRNEAGFCTSCVADPSVATTAHETTTIQLTGGHATIDAVQVRRWISDPNQPAIWFITSTGYDETTKLSGSTSSVLPMRAVGVYALWSKTVVNVQGAWFALSGLHKNGSSGRIDGTDNCAAADGGGAATVAGASVPSGGQFSGNTSAFVGSPPIDTTKTFAQLKANAKIDWAGILAGSIPADFDVPTQSFPSSSWFSNHPDEWPVIRVHTSGYSLPNAGRGMIIADGDFTISGSNMWDGVVLIGGALTSNGNNTTSGATLSGLNYLLGGTPGASSDDSDANGQKTYVYNSCNVAKASSGLRTYKAVTNTWVDNIPVW